MTYELTADEIAIIADWYRSASGESATGRDQQMFDLLEKLGIEAIFMDLWLQKPEGWTEASRPRVIASNAAISAYLERHPELKESQ